MNNIALEDDELLNEEKILDFKAYTSSKNKAEKMLKDDDTDQIELILTKLEKKLKDVPGIGKKLANVPVLIALTRSYIRKEYTAIPLLSMVAILGALIYIVAPIDAIPDIIPGVGLVDDAAVLLIASKMVETDVECYKEWKEKKEQA